MCSPCSLYSRVSFCPAVCLHEILITCFFFFALFILLLPTPTKPNLDTVVCLHTFFGATYFIIATFRIYG